MEQTDELDVEISIPPYKLNNVNLLDFVKDVIECTIKQGKYIKEVCKVSTKSIGKITMNGHVVYNVKCECVTLEPKLNETYDICIHNMNKMGAIHKNNLVTIFIPRSYWNNIDIELNMTVSVKIIGKRIEDKIMCIGQINNSLPN